MREVRSQESLAKVITMYVLAGAWQNVSKSQVRNMSKKSKQVAGAGERIASASLIWTRW